MKISNLFAAGLLATSIATAAEGEDQTSTPAKKSEPSFFSVGVRAAYNYNTMFGLSDEWNIYADDAEEPSGNGFEGGLAIRLQLLPFMQFTPEVLFNYTKLTQDDGDTDREFEQMGVEIPVLLRVTPIEWVYLVVGPTIEFNVSDEEHLNSGEMDAAGDKYYHEFPEGYDRKAVQFGLTLGIGGYAIPNRLSFDIRLNLGMFNDVYEGRTLKDSSGKEYKGSKLIDLSGGKQMAFKFGLGFWFM
ncbi:MAG: PorT family protein [Fibrobacter sp.]|nr:PorT family protein [Fibrobacter sp.]